jgi:sec-independent protein translocase protein TatA
MGSFSIWHWLVVLAIVLLIFGAGRLPSVMGDLAKGVKNFKAGLKEGEQPEPTPTGSAAKQIPEDRPDHAAALAAAQQDERR